MAISTTPTQTLAMTHWAKLEERGIIWGMRFLLSIYLLLGRRCLQLFLYPVVSYYWLSNRTARQASQAYLQRLSTFGVQHRYTSYQHFISFANAIADKLAAWSGSLSLTNVVYRGRDQLLNELNQGQGLILLGSHLGNLEVCRVIATSNAPIPINVLVHTKHAEKFNQLLKQYNPNSSLNLIQVTEITAATSILLSDKIANGELVIIAADRTPVNNEQRVSHVDFLGAKAPFPQGPFILAALLNCPVYTVFCLKDQAQHIIHFEHFSDKLNFPRNNRQAAMQQSIQDYANRLQHYCLIAPLQWFNFFDFWATHD
jgi:predicted LPLAT superfamily acyltransferase